MKEIYRNVEGINKGPIIAILLQRRAAESVWLLSESKTEKTQKEQQSRKLQNAQIDLILDPLIKIRILKAKIKKLIIKGRINLIKIIFPKFQDKHSSSLE